MPELPASVRLALWVTLAWRGDLSLAEAVRRAQPDVDHVTGALPALQAWAELGEQALFVALPRPGDLTGMPGCPLPAGGHAVESGECVYVAGVGGLLVPTLSRFGPEGDVGLRIDWTAYDADPVPRHRLEMLDLRDVERALLLRLREYAEAFESAGGGAPWDGAARAAADAALQTRVWGLPDAVPDPARRVITLAAAADTLAGHAERLTARGAAGPGVGTSARRERLVRSLAADADRALADAANVAIMSLVGWRPA